MLVIFFLLKIPIVYKIASLKILGPDVFSTSEFQILENIKHMVSNTIYSHSLRPGAVPHNQIHKYFISKPGNTYTKVE